MSEGNSSSDARATTSMTTTQHHTKICKYDDSEQLSGGSQGLIPRDLLEVEEVDMNDESMDPFEWAARKLVPIPKQYYWEATTEDNSADDGGLVPLDPKELPLKLKLWHRSVSAMGSAVRLTDSMGKSIGSYLGLSSSRFDYVTSTMNEQEWESSRQMVNARREEHQKERLEEGGGGGQEEGQ